MGPSRSGLQYHPWYPPPWTIGRPTSSLLRDEITLSRTRTPIPRPNFLLRRARRVLPSLLRPLRLSTGTQKEKGIEIEIGIGKDSPSHLHLQEERPITLPTIACPRGIRTTSITTIPCLLVNGKNSLSTSFGIMTPKIDKIRIRIRIRRRILRCRRPR